MKLSLLTGDPKFAKKAENCGVDRIFLDLEYIKCGDSSKSRMIPLGSKAVDSLRFYHTKYSTRYQAFARGFK